MVYFTSDTHFGHKNIIKYCDRPFPDVVKMNNLLIHNWNDTVKPEDTIYHLGDFALMSFDPAKSILNKLNGYKILVRGNHDRTPKRMSEMGFDVVTEEAWYLGWRMAHVPYELRKGDWGLCGHVHERWTRYGRLINVGVDRWNFTPRTLDEITKAKQDCSRIPETDMKLWRRG